MWHCYEPHINLLQLQRRNIFRSSMLLHIYVWFYFICRAAGGGSITPHVQKFILETCTSSNVNDLFSCCLAKFTQLIQIRYIHICFCN